MKYICLILIFLISNNLFSQEITKEFRNIIGEIQYAESINADSAITMANSYLKKYPNHPDYQAELYLEISQCYGFLGKSKERLTYALKSKEMTAKGENYNHKTRINGLIAFIYRDLNFTEKAKTTLKEGLNNAIKISDNKEKYYAQSLLLTEYAKILSDEKEYDSASIYLAESLGALSNLKVSPSTNYQYAITYLALARNSILEENWTEAEGYLDKVIKLPNNIKWFDYFYSGVQIERSLIYTHRKQYQKAIDTLMTAEKILLADKTQKPEFYSILSKNYKQLGNIKMFSKYNDLYLESSANISEEDKKALNESVQILDNIIKAESEKRKFNQNLLIGLSIIALIVISGLTYFYKRKQKRNKELYQQIISKLELQLNEKNTGTGIDFPKENQYQNSDKQPDSQQDEIVKTSSISDATEQELIRKLQKFEKSERFTNKDLSISLLATQLGTNTKYLSEVISKHYGKNYNTYINDLRIDYICRKMVTDPESRKFKISYLADLCGFSSYNTFTTIFKNNTGMSPSAFLKEAALQD